MEFKNDKHESFYNKYVAITNTQKDPYHKSFFYTLGLTEETRKHVNELYDFDLEGIKPTGVRKAWQTGTSSKVTRLAFNLFNGFDGNLDGTLDEQDSDNPYLYTPENIFCTDLMPYMFEAVKLRYPIYAQEYKRILNTNNSLNCEVANKGNIEI